MADRFKDFIKEETLLNEGANKKTMKQIVDRFSDLSTKIGYTFPVQQLGNNIEFYGGVKNIFNSYQDDFDIGKNRDSNYVYGPAQPRTFFVGVSVKGR